MNLQAKENTWSHQRKKRRQKQREEFDCAMSVTQTDNAYNKEIDAEKNNLKNDEGISNEVSVTETENAHDKVTESDDVLKNELKTGDWTSDEVAKMDSGTGLDPVKTGYEIGNTCRNKDSLHSGTSPDCKSSKPFDKNETIAQQQNQIKENVGVVNENNQNSFQKEIDNSACELCCSKSDSNFNNSARLGATLKEMEKVEDAQVGIGCKRKYENPESSEQTLKKKRLDSAMQISSDKHVGVPVQETNNLNEVGAPMDKKVCAIGVANSGDKLSNTIDPIVKTNAIVALSSLSSCGDEPDLHHQSQVTHLRKDVVEEFHKEKEHNKEIEESNKNQSKKTKYHNFDESEDCLVMFKMILRKEDGIITLAMEHKAGNKEAMHQIMQHFKNKFTAASP